MDDSKLKQVLDEECGIDFPAEYYDGIDSDDFCIVFKAGMREVAGKVGEFCYIWHDDNNKAHVSLDKVAWQAFLQEQGL